MASTENSTSTALATTPSNVSESPRAVAAAGRSLSVARAASGGRAQPSERLANSVMRATSAAPRP
ncbi:hypothetical protein D3C81_1724100 [compost metagenome]